MKKVIYCALALMALSSCGSKQQKTTKSNKDAKVVTTSAIAKAEVITIEETYTSEIKPFKEVNITPAASGIRIDKILVDVGDNVRAGQLLATLDPTQYNQHMTSLENLRADYSRLESVYKAGGLARQALDQAKTNLSIQEEVAKNLKKNIQVLSPISGVVTARFTEAGNLFVAQPILTIMQIDRLKVMADVPEIYFPDVKVGMKVNVKSEVYPDQVFEGKVSLISPAISPDTRTFSVEVTLPNASKALRPGMFARTIFAMRSKDGIMIPDVAVQKQIGTDDRFIYVNNNGKAERRGVVVGRLVGAEYDILSGVEVGDEVITTAFSRIVNGTEIEIQ